MSMYRTINPATGKTEREFELHTKAQAFEKLEAAHQFYNSDWRHRSFDERKAILAKAAQILEQNKEKYARLIAIEMGKVLSESIAETELSAHILRYYAENAEKFLAPREIEVATGRATVLSQSLGVIYCVEPWNFPYYQLARVAGPNLMAGNVVLAKHAPGVPQCALAFEACCSKPGLQKGPGPISSSITMSPRN